MKQIKLTQGKFTLVNDEDYEYLNQWKWHTYKSKGIYYARRYDCSNGGKKNIKMHRLLLNAEGEVLVDHIDGDGLNNQRVNIRLCTARQNAINRRGWGSSKYTGVSFDKESKKWRARINTGFAKINIGRFAEEEKAAVAYNAYAKKYHGEFARLNVIPL